MCPRNILVQQLECDDYRNYMLFVRLALRGRGTHTPAQDHVVGAGAWRRALSLAGECCLAHESGPRVKDPSTRVGGT